MNKLSQTINLGPSGGFRGIGPLGLEGKGSTSSLGIFSQVISSTIGIITIIAIIWFLIQLLTGAVSIIGSGGDKSKMEAARNRITTSLIGFVVVIVGIFLLDFLGSIMGLGNILDISGAILKLIPK